ncbi:MAG: helix-turn-helix transcriptional regulator [Actinobacteria bacterium]|nr:helix-turn-helix transcriptional regulator [Actinomycetota bacterium]
MNTTTTPSVADEVVDRLAAMIESCGLDVDEVAARAGLTTTVLSRILASPSRLTVNQLGALADALGLSVAALIGASPDPYGEPATRCGVIGCPDPSHQLSGAW